MQDFPDPPQQPPNGVVYVFATHGYGQISVGQWQIQFESTFMPEHYWFRWQARDAHGASVMGEGEDSLHTFIFEETEYDFNPLSY